MKEEERNGIICRCRDFERKLNNNDLKEKWHTFCDYYVDAVELEDNDADGELEELNRYLLVLEHAMDNNPDIKYLADFARNTKTGELCKFVTRYCPNGEKLFHEICEEICQNLSQQLDQERKWELDQKTKWGKKRPLGQSEIPFVMVKIKKYTMFAQTFDNNDLNEEWLRLLDMDTLMSPHRLDEIANFAHLIQGARENDMRSMIYHASSLEPDRLCWVVKKFCPNGEKLIHEIFEGICKENSKAPQTTEQGMER